jgi:bifunctional DNase/RNase
MRALHLVLVGLYACGAASSPSPSTVVVPVGATSSTEPQAAPAEATPRKATPPKVPPDYVEMTVVGVVPSNDGDSVVLADPAKETLVPIFIGGTEAMSIALRFGKRHYERPLTHDLLDAVMRELGGELERVQVDDLRDDVFIASLLVRQGTRFAIVDSRPSDAIALAIGNKVPIYMARRVLDAAGITRDDLDGGVGSPGMPPRPFNP